MLAGLATIVAMAVLWPDGSGRAQRSGDGPTQVPGTVLKVSVQPCPAAPDGGGQPGAGDPAPGQPGPCGTVTVRLTGGTDAGKQVETPMPAGPGAPRVDAGDRVTLVHTAGSVSGMDYQITDHRRGLQLWLLAAVFAVVVLVFGGFRGVGALVGLTVTFAVLLIFIVPAIIDGRPPLLVAIVGSAAIMLSVLYLTHGFTLTTSVAVLGTLTSLTLTGILAGISTAALNLTGFGSEEAVYLSVTFHDVNLKGLLLAGIVIGSLGVLDDIAVTQAATVSEIATANPGLPARQLYQAGSRVGRAHITSVINTIILAYAGASLPLLILITAGGEPVADILTNQMMAQEIVRSVVGTIGLVAAVPVTTAMAAVAARRLPGPRPDPTGDTGSGTGSHRPRHERAAPGIGWGDHATHR